VSSDANGDFTLRDIKALSRRGEFLSAGIFVLLRQRARSGGSPARVLVPPLRREDPQEEKDFLGEFSGGDALIRPTQTAPRLVLALRVRDTSTLRGGRTRPWAPGPSP